jgi:glycosyltransferase involved in cell wall biosynthesis
MKIALVGIKGDFAKESGSGIVRYTLELSNFLLSEGIDLEQLEFNNLFDYTAKVTFGNFDKYDLIHNPNIKITTPLRKGKSKLITTVHDLTFIFNLELYNERLLKRQSISSMFKKYLSAEYAKISISSSIRLSDHLITDSNLVKRELIRLGLSKEQISVIPLGIDKRFRETPLPKKKRGFTVGYFGSFQRKKNVEFAIDAFDKFTERNKTNSIFELWGSTHSPEYQYIRSIAKNPRIMFKGFAPENRIVQIYDRFDAAIFPIWSAGFELEILEAQSRGIPVITYRHSKIPEEVRKYCLEAKDSVHAAQILNQIAKNGYNAKTKIKAMNYARSFTWEKTARETLKVYRKVLK